MSFLIKDDSVLLKYNDVLNKIEKMLGMKFHSKSVYDEKYIRARVKAFNCVINTIFWNYEIPKG